MSVPGVKRPSESQFIADEPQRKKQKQKHDFSFPKGWTAEWAGEKGRNFVYTAIANSTTLSHAHGPVSVVVQYLQKNDIFGLANLERIAGGKEKLAQLLPGYQPEKPIPEELEHLLQLDLGQLFTRKQILRHLVLKPFKDISRVTELFSLYWYPARMTPKITKQLAGLHSLHFCGRGEDFLHGEVDSFFHKHGNTPAPEDCWILFPNGTFRSDLRKGHIHKEARLVAPRNFGLPRPPEALFCISMKYISTRQSVLFQTIYEGGNDSHEIIGPCLATAVQKWEKEVSVWPRNYREGLHIGGTYDEFSPGGAFMRRFV